MRQGMCMGTLGGIGGHLYEVREVCRPYAVPSMGRVQTTCTEFWEILNPLPICGHIY